LGASSFAGWHGEGSAWNTNLTTYHLKEYVLTIRFDFSNLPCKILPQFEQYLDLLYRTNKKLNNSYETNMFLSGFTREDDETFFVLFDKLDEVTVQVSGIASAVYTDNTPIIWSLATNLFSERADLDFYIYKRCMPRKMFIAHWQCFLIKDMRNEKAVPMDGLPAVTFEAALNNIMLN
tara:strand:+ start:6123 stop:6656 length:534 start_codon:yes stop_codon:yes gene_type:complete